MASGASSLMIAWEKYSAGEDYANSFKWAAHDEHRKGSMWAAFNAGWLAARGTEYIDFDEKARPADGNAER